jgi:hypothetical protein
VCACCNTGKLAVSGTCIEDDIATAKTMLSNINHLWSNS